MGLPTILVSAPNVAVSATTRKNLGLNPWPDGILGRQVPQAGGNFFWFGANNGNNSRATGTLVNPGAGGDADSAPIAIGGKPGVYSCAGGGPVIENPIDLTGP